MFISKKSENLLFKIATRAIVAQKNTPGQSDESVMAKATVTTNIRTSTSILTTIRAVRFPL